MEKLKSYVHQNNVISYNENTKKQIQEKYMPCIFLIQEIRNISEIELEKKKLKIDDLRNILDIEGTIAGNAFLLNVGQETLQIELVSVSHILKNTTRKDIAQKRWLLRKCLNFSNSDKVCNMAIVKVKESGGKYDFATLELDFTFYNEFQSKEFPYNKRYGMTKENPNFNKSEFYFKPYCGDYESALSIPFVMVGFEDFVLKVNWDVRVEAQISSQLTIQIDGGFKEGSSGKPLFSPVDGTVLGMATHYHANEGKKAVSYWVLDVSRKSLPKLLEATKGKKEPFTRNQINEYPSTFEENLNSPLQTPTKENKLECVSVGEINQSGGCFDKNSIDQPLKELKILDSPDHTDWLEKIVSYMESEKGYTEKDLFKLKIPGYNQKINGEELFDYHKPSVRKEALTQGVRNGILSCKEETNKYRKDPFYRYTKVDK
jgi:hypothetical protein